MQLFTHILHVFVIHSWVLDFYLHMNSTNLISLIIYFVLFLAWTVLPYINLWLYFLFH